MTSDSFRKVLLGDDPFGAIKGQEQVKKQIRSALIAGRHIIIVGPPGIGKTTLAKNVAELLPKKELNDCAYHCDPKAPQCPECRKANPNTRNFEGAERFVRVQGSPDLTSEDLLGDIDPIKALKFGPLSFEAFTPGKIFKANKGVLFFDELNRCPEKLQNALLQILEEKQATIGAYKVDFKADFIFIGTMNPADSSTEALSQVFVDRFDFIYMNYPENAEIEEQIMIEKGKKLAEVPDEFSNLIVNFIHELRSSDQLEQKPGVRATLGLYERAQANALVDEREKVEFEDIKDAVISVLSHRIRLKPSSKYLVSPEQFVAQTFNKFLEDQATTQKGGYR